MTLSRRLKIWMVFALLGPFVGVIALMIFALGSAAASNAPSTYPLSWLTVVSLFLMWGVPFAYLLAGLPAALTGAIMAILAGRLPSPGPWLLCAMIAGGTSAGWLTGVPVPNWNLIMAVVGSGAALVAGCATLPLARTKVPLVD